MIFGFDESFGTDDPSPFGARVGAGEFAQLWPLIGKTEIKFAPFNSIGINQMIRGHLRDRICRQNGLGPNDAVAGDLLTKGV